jgi:mono/diheme cytochrome c family protein
MRLSGFMGILGCAFLAAAGLFSCSQSSSAGLSAVTVGNQLADGAQIYSQTCATSSCHGTAGEGIPSGSGFSAWPLVGSDFQHRHPNAEVVFDVVRSGGEVDLRALTDQQIYDAIAYELHQNQISLREPLTAANAFATYGGEMAGSLRDGVFPPPGAFTSAASPPHAPLPLSAGGGRLHLQLDQFAEAETVAGTHPPQGGAFLVLVIVLTDVGSQPLAVGPSDLHLVEAGGQLKAPLPINAGSAIEGFHEQMIQPQHGTAALVIFQLTAPDRFDHLIYADRLGDSLTLDLKP